MKKILILAAAFIAPHALAEEVKIPWERDFHHYQKTVTAGSNPTWRAGVATQLCRDKINEAAAPLNANTNMTDATVYEETVRTKTETTWDNVRSVKVSFDYNCKGLLIINI